MKCRRCWELFMEVGVAGILVACVAVFSGANWSMGTPTQGQTVSSSASIPCGGGAPNQGLAFAVQFWHKSQAEYMVTGVSGTTTGPQGMPQMANWEATLNPPTGHWPHPGTDWVTLVYYSPSSGSITHSVSIIP
ncbi:MAG: hypothetical protein FJ297_09690 [Planctomycetes bacterium]|nr:hypothetical protein [Planctomycetota bacterium]